MRSIAQPYDAGDHDKVNTQGGENQQRKGVDPEEKEQRQADGAQVGGDHIHLAVGRS